MPLRSTDLAILSCPFGVARFGASRFGFCPDDVEGAGTDEPGEYVWKEDKPPETCWTLVSLFSFCGEGPTASFTIDNDTPNQNDPVQFTDTSTPDVLITSWLWDFGDGNTSQEQNPSHIYETAAIFTVTLTVFGIRGCAEATDTVDVQGV